MHRPRPLAFSGAVRLGDGTVATPAVTDAGSDGFGAPFGMTRSWTNQLGFNYHSPVGNGWVVSDMPYLVQGTSTVMEVDNGRGARYFDSDGNADAPTYTARFFTQDKLAYAQSSDTFTLSDSAGNTLAFYGFGQSLKPAQRGQIQSLTDPGGNVTTYQYNPADGTLATVTRGGGAETWSFQWAPADPSQAGGAQHITSVELRRTIGAQPGLVRSIDYAYYGTGDADGAVGDLKSVTVSDAQGNLVSAYHYRYEKLPAPQASSGSGDGSAADDVSGDGAASGSGSASDASDVNPPLPPPSRLTWAVGPRGVALLQGQGVDVTQAGEGQLAPVADLHLTYSPDGTVDQQTVQGAGASSPGQPSAVGTFTYGFDPTGIVGADGSDKGSEANTIRLSVFGCLFRHFRLRLPSRLA